MEKRKTSTYGYCGGEQRGNELDGVNSLERGEIVEFEMAIKRRRKEFVALVAESQSGHSFVVGT